MPGSRRAFSRYTGADFVRLADDQQILNWDDDRAIAILRRVRAGMPGSGRVLVVDPVLPPRDQPSSNKPVNLLLLALLGSGGG